MFNHVLNRQKNKSAEPITTVPKKDIFLVLPFLGSQSEVLARRDNSCVSTNFMVLSILGSVFKVSVYPKIDNFAKF